MILFFKQMMKDLLSIRDIIQEENCQQVTERNQLEVLILESDIFIRCLNQKNIKN